MSEEPGPATSRRFLVRGRVQGVGFRAFVVSRARALGLAGYARNLPDGRVEVVARGPAPALMSLAEDLAEGPPLSRVDAVEAGEAAGSLPPDGFRIAH